MSTSLQKPNLAKQNNLKNLGSIYLAKLKNWWQVYKEPFRLWLAFRIALIILPIMAGLLIPFQENPPLPADYIPASNVFLERSLRSWVRWDGGFYIAIAREGYISVTPSDNARAAFFPLYPHLLRATGFIVGLGKTSYTTLNLGGIIVSTLAALACALGLYRLGRHEFDETTGKFTVGYLLAYPVAFFLLAVYTESLFLALAIWAFYAARTGRWWWANLLCALAILTRNQGALVAVALGLEYLHQIGFNPRRLNLKILSFGLPVLAQLLWMWINYQNFGNPFEYIKVQDLFARSFKWPQDTLWAATELFFRERSPGSNLPKNYDTGSILYDYPITLGFIGLGLVGLYLVWRGRLRLCYMAYFWLALLQPLAQPAKETWLAGMPRFFLIIFPAFFILALAGQRWKTFNYLYLGVCLPLGGLLLARFILNYWVA